MLLYKTMVGFAALVALASVATNANAQGFYGSYNDYYAQGPSVAPAAVAAPQAQAPAAAVPQAAPARSGWTSGWFGNAPAQAAAAQPAYQPPANYVRTRSWMPPTAAMNNDRVRPEDLYGYYYPRYANVQVRDSAPGGELSSSTPIEIWLSQRAGQFGPYRFAALGGTREDPTPTGRFATVKKQEDYVSRKFDQDMPYAVFFTQACAIHVGSLSYASHGCIHVDWEIGELMYRYAKPGKTPIIIHP